MSDREFEVLLDTVQAVSHWLQILVREQQSTNDLLKQIDQRFDHVDGQQPSDQQVKETH